MNCRFLLFTFNDCLFAEKEGNTPQAGQCDYGINQPAEQGTCTAEKPGNQIKLKNTDEPPVEAADNCQNQSNGIHRITSIQVSDMVRMYSFFFFIRNCIANMIGFRYNVFND